MRTDGDSCHKGSEQEANLVSKIEPKYLPDFLMPAKGKIEKGGMAGVGVSTTDRLQTPTTAFAFHRQLHSRSHQPTKHRPVWGDVKVGGKGVLAKCIKGRIFEGQASERVQAR
jgi:hypothetical protein